MEKLYGGDKNDKSLSLFDGVKKLRGWFTLGISGACIRLCIRKEVYKMYEMDSYDKLGACIAESRRGTM